MANNRELSQFANVVGYNGGNIGIGTDDPNGLLSLTAASGRLVTLRNSTTGFASGDGSYLALNGSDLQIANAESANLILYTGDTERLRITSTGQLQATSAADVRLTLGSSGTAGTNDSVHVRADSANLKFMSASGGGTIFEANGTETVRIDSGGRLQVGRSASDSSDSLLIVQGNAGDSGTGGQMSIQRGGNANPTAPSDLGSLIFKDSAASRGAVIAAVCDGDWASSDYPTRLEFKVTADGDSSPTEQMRLTSAGRLMLGTTTEGYVSADNFTIADTGNCGLTIRSATNGLGTIAFSDATSGTGEYSGYIQYSQSTRILTFGTESDDHVRIDNNGHLEVAYDSSNNARVQFGFSSGVWITGNSSDGHQRFYTNSGQRILSGYNGQGTEFHNQNSVRPGADNTIDLGSGSYRYDDVYATNGTIQTSDSRLKQEVVTSVLGIDFIKALRPVSYKWIEGKKIPIVDGTDENGDNIYRSDADGNWVYNSRAGARRHWGFIAQEVKQVVDDAGVDFAGWSLADKDDPDSRQSLRYEEFIAPLTKALQEAIAKIETLETQNADLLARVTALEGS